MSQHGATGWPNAHNMLRPTMLRYVAFTCCDRLAGALLHNIVISNSGVKLKFLLLLLLQLWWTKNLIPLKNIDISVGCGGCLKLRAAGWVYKLHAPSWARNRLNKCAKLVLYTTTRTFLFALRYLGYWPSLFGQDGSILAKFFSRVFMNQDEIKDGIKYQSMIKFPCGIPSGQDSSFLPVRVANHSARFGSPCPPTEVVI